MHSIISFMQNRIFDREVHSRGPRNMKNVPLSSFPHCLCFWYIPHMFWVFSKDLSVDFVVWEHSFLFLFTDMRYMASTYKSSFFSKTVGFKKVLGTTFFLEMINFLNLNLLQACCPWGCRRCTNNYIFSFRFFCWRWNKWRCTHRFNSF